jgi:hypothetical protein
MEGKQASRLGERRQQRSNDAHTALSLQLAQVKRDARLEALVLATAEGLVIAHAGDDELCCELAAIAPVVCAEGALPAQANLGHGFLHVQSVPWDGSPLYLAGSRSVSGAHEPLVMERWLERAQAGVTRILAA